MNVKKVHPQSGKSFDDLFIILVVCSLTLIAIFILLVFIRGPRIREVTFNPELPTQYTGVWLVLHTNQPLRTVHTQQVSTTPQTPVHVLSSGSEVAVQFQRRLAYNTVYTVKVNTEPVKLTYRFRTPQAISYYLTSPGTIKEHILGQPTDKIVYSAPFINEFALTGDYMAVVEPASATDKLVIVNTATGGSYQAALPMAGTIQELKASPDGQDFSFTFTSLRRSGRTDYNTTLFSFSTVTKTAIPVKGFDDQPLTATDWSYSPDGSVIVAQTTSSVIEAVYLNSSSPPLPVGAYGILSGFSFDGSLLYVGSVQKGLETLNIATRKIATLNPAPLGQGSSLQLVTPLLNGSGYIMQVQKTSPSGPSLAQYVMLVEGGNMRTLYASPDGSESIVGISMSPNDQYLSIEVAPTGFANPGGTTTAGTIIVDIATGKVVDRVSSLEQMLWQ